MAISDKEISALPYEAARDLLNTVVDGLDDSELPLSDLMKLWEIGEKIAAVCEAHLNAAAQTLDTSNSSDSTE
jgi:exodeoxyribonuclease VII small subunit